jgi:hypothetical protein
VLGGILHLKPKEGCQISILYLDFLGGAINIPLKIANGRQRDRKSTSFGNLLWDIYMVPHKKNPNIKVDI